MKRLLCMALALLLCLTFGQAASALVNPGDVPALEEEESGGLPSEDPSEDPTEDPSEPPEDPLPDELFSGDADGDGRVTVSDARGILRMAVGLENVREDLIVAADYDNDGAVTVTDARLTLRAAIALDPLVHPGEYKAPPKEPEKETPAEKPEPPADPALDAANAVSPDRLSADMKWLVETVGVRSWWDLTQNAFADPLIGRLKDLGFSNVDKYAFKKDGITGYNVMAILPTKAKAPDIYVFCTHYDTARGTGGAVDNSSGVALLLELARIVSAADVDFGAEVRFLFTAGEEQGYYGAYAYLDGLSASERAKHRFFFNTDMAGRPVGGKYYLTVSTQPSYTYAYPSPAATANMGSDAVDEAYAALGADAAAGYYSPVRAGYHDIIPFCKAGYPALTLSWRTIDKERSGSADHGLASPSLIHSKSDNIAHFHMESLYQTTRIAAYAAARLLYGER